MFRLRHARDLFAPRAPEPSYPVLPYVRADGATSVPGVFAAGEIAGQSLLKTSLNAGHDLAVRLAAELAREGEPPGGDVLDLVIVGAGAAGLAAAAAARELGRSAVVLEAAHLAETIRGMTRGKVIFAEPEGVENRSRLPLREGSREDLLAAWSAAVRDLGLDVREQEAVHDIRRATGTIEVLSARASYRVRRVILAIGTAGRPRRAGVPGERENADRVSHRLVDPAAHPGRDIFIYGAGDVALEAALALYRSHRVTLATIDPAFTHPRRRNVDAVTALVRQGKLRVHLRAHLREIGNDTVTFTTGGPHGPPQTIAADQVFEMIGSELPIPFLRKVGLRLENAWDVRRWMFATAVFLGVYAVYSIKSYGKGLVAWPWEQLIPPDTYRAGLLVLFRPVFAPFRALFTDAAYRDILSSPAYQQGFLYSGLYTVVLLAFGAAALLRWRRIARRPVHQTRRYLTLFAFQIGFFVLVNVVAVQALSTQYAWRAWGLYQPFPLFFNTFFWWSAEDPARVRWFFVGAGLAATFVAIPWAAWRHGKRFCSWVCGCGGLAETLGDRWRHLSAKGTRSRRWEFQAYVILLASAVVALVVVGLHGTRGDNGWWRAYAYLVDFWLVAVLPMAAYPFFGGKVWCRYWCPLAAWNQLLAKRFGTLAIAANDRCISCRQCSRHCQVGVDVMAFARNGESFDNRNTSCIQCGICIDVCPMDVLSFRRSAAGAASVASR